MLKEEDVISGLAVPSDHIFNHEPAKTAEDQVRVLEAVRRSYPFVITSPCHTLSNSCGRSMRTIRIYVVRMCR
jgi:hypothetical protein